MNKQTNMSVQPHFEEQPVEEVAPKWMSVFLVHAGVYNLLFGVWAMIFPDQMFNLLELPVMNYPQFFQGIGMMVFVMGAGYLVASRAPYEHWVIIMVGFLGKALTSLGVLYFYIVDDTPFSFFYVTIPNDLIWLIPFGFVLWGKFSLKMNESIMN